MDSCANGFSLALNDRKLRNSILDLITMNI